MIIVDVKKNLQSEQGIFNLEVNLRLTNNDLVALYGPSGAGKTTLLRMIAGLTDPDEGYIEIDGDVWFDSVHKINKPTRKREIGYVFQDHNLFPNMSIWENLTYALKDKKDIKLAHDLLETMEIANLRHYRPSMLSGGQTQRVALIRAFLRQPKVFLFDEPLSSLDWALRLNLQKEILKLRDRFMIPTIFVTHDLGEVFKIAKQIFVLEEGKLVKQGKPSDVYGQNILNSQLQLTGTIIDLVQEDSLFVVTVQIGCDLTRILSTGEEARSWQVGDKVLVSAKAFNPHIHKL